MSEAECVVLAVTGLALAALLTAEWRGARLPTVLAKLTASTGFVVFALLRGALHTDYGLAILAGLLLSWLGDALLLQRGTGGGFRAGLAAFLLAHVAYVVAFALAGLDARWLAVAAALVVVAAFLALRWLAPHVHGGMRLPVRAYVLVISSMLVAAAGATGAVGEPLLLAGASAFYLSDLAVARQRFVARSLSNKLWGLPLYYGGQLLLAASVAG